MNALKSIGSNYNAGERSSIFKNKDSTGRASVLVGVASVSPVILLVAHILRARNGHWRRENDLAANTGWDVKSLRRD
jgi:hypothetical protein